MGLDDDLHDICAVVSERILRIEELKDYFEKAEEFEGEASVLVGCMVGSSIITGQNLKLGTLQSSKLHLIT